MDSILRAWLRALPDDVESFSAIARSVDTELWPSLLERAAGHGVLGVIAPFLDVDRLPIGVREWFERQQIVRAMWYERLVRSLEDAVSVLNVTGVRVCALKGPALASRLYGDPTARSSTDLDLLVAPDDIERAADAFRLHGYAGEEGATAAYLLRHGHHLRFSKAGHTAIELHFHTYAGFGVVLPSSALLERATSYQVSPTCSVLVPAPEDEFIYLAVHAAGHAFARLLWLSDMKLLLRQHPRLRWDVVASRSQTLGVATAVRYSVELLNRWLDLAIDARGELPTRGVRIAVANAMLSSASRLYRKSPLNNFKGLLFTAMLCDRPRSTAWLIQHHLLRTVRRRVHRFAPRLSPESWSG